MTTSLKSLDPRTLAKLEGLRLRARRIVEGYLAGLHRSPYRGFSIEFAEHREYAPGDDLRYLDWKVFGRTDKLYLKQFEDETNLICQLVVDVSGSMNYRGRAAALSKLEYAQCLSASLAWLVLRQQDSTGLITFDTTVRDRVPASSSASHLNHLIEILERSGGEGDTSLGLTLEHVASTLTRRGIVVIISDLFDDLASLMKGLHRLRLRRHDVVVLQVLDRDELDFPFDSPTMFQGMERQADVFVDAPSVRDAYRAEFGQFRGALERACREHAIDYRMVRTDQPLDLALSSFLTSRMSKIV